MMFMSYTILFLALVDVGLHGYVEVELRGSTLVNLTKFARTGKILWGSCQGHSGNGFTMYFCCCVCFILFDR